GSEAGPGAEAAKRLAGLMTKLAEGPADLRQNAAHAFIWPLDAGLANLQSALEGRKILQETLPPGLVTQWMTPDGKARVSIAAKGDANDIPAMRAFVRAVAAVDPKVTGGPVSTLAAGDMILTAFLQAGALAVVSIAVLLWITLRRV